MLNKTIVMGRLTADPELRHTANGTAVATFSIACERDRKAENGERPVDFLDVVAWRGTAEFAANYFQKGRMAVVSGSLQTRNWTDKDGNSRKTVEIVADSLYFADSKKDGGAAKHAESARGTAPSAASSLPSGSADDFEAIDTDDGALPF